MIGNRAVLWTDLSIGVAKLLLTLEKTVEGKGKNKKSFVLDKTEAEVAVAVRCAGLFAVGHPKVRGIADRIHAAPRDTRRVQSLDVQAEPSVGAFA